MSSSSNSVLKCTDCDRTNSPHTCENVYVWKESNTFEESLTTHPGSRQPMDFSDAPARVRLNMRRCHSERPKQRRVLEDPVGDEVMIGENLANEAVERQWSEVSATEFERLTAQRIFGETERASITRRFDEHAG